MIDSDFSNLQIRAEYADWLEDNDPDSDKSEIQRWMVENKRYPCRVVWWKSSPHYLVLWYWYSEDYKPNGYYTLPNHVWKHLQYTTSKCIRYVGDLHCTFESIKSLEYHTLRAYKEYKNSSRILICGSS